MHIKAIAKYLFIPNRTAKVKILPKLSVDKGIKNKDSHTVLVKGKWA